MKAFRRSEAAFVHCHRALTVEPKVLLLDEPCSALDVKASAKIEELLKNLKEC